MYSVFHICPLPFLVENNDQTIKKRHTRTLCNSYFVHQRVFEWIEFPFWRYAKTEHKAAETPEWSKVNFSSPVVVDPSQVECSFVVFVFRSWRSYCRKAHHAYKLNIWKSKTNVDDVLNTKCNMWWKWKCLTYSLHIIKIQPIRALNTQIKRNWFTSYQ